VPSQGGRGTQIDRFGVPADGDLEDQPADHIGGSFRDELQDAFRQDGDRAAEVEQFRRCGQQLRTDDLLPTKDTRDLSGAWLARALDGLHGSPG
jgi:hypothetical protein